MDAWVPFFQTLLWILLITGVLWRFNAQAIAILNAIKRRIEQGSSFKAGPVELGQDLRPQEPEQQKKRLDDEVKQAQQEDASSHVQLVAKLSESDFRGRILVAEELAMRELQTEFDVVVNRQVLVGRDFGMDGMFVKDGGAFGVELKYVRKNLRREHLKQIIFQYKNFAQSRGWKRFTMVLVFVYDGEDAQLSKQQEFLNSTLSEFQDFVLWRLYSLKQLTEKYGISLSTNS